MNKIFDCFNFFNELDILELRLNILNDYVDYFVIVESNVTHTGKPKEFFYENNKERFAKFSNKIIHYKVYDTPNDFINLPQSNDQTVNLIYSFIEKQHNRFNRNYQPNYGRDFYQKECVRRPLINLADDNDIIIISDADEISNPEVIENLKNFDLNNNIYSLNQNMYYYYFNVLKQKDWFGSRIGLYKNLKTLSFNEVRGDDSLSIRIPNGGWHFSFQGGTESIIKKLQSYSANDMANNYVLNNIENNIQNNIDPFFRGNLTVVPIDETYPKYLINNIEKYKNFLK